MNKINYFKTVLFIGILAVPWAFIVAATDYLWGFALGYLIIPAVIWVLAWKAHELLSMKWVVGASMLSFVISYALANQFDSKWGYFFKPLTLPMLVTLWNGIVIAVLVLIILSRWQKEKLNRINR